MQHLTTVLRSFVRKKLVHKDENGLMCLLSLACDEPEKVQMPLTALRMICVMKKFCYVNVKVKFGDDGTTVYV